MRLSSGSSRSAADKDVKPSVISRGFLLYSRIPQETALTDMLHG